jgi:hypothetical protein
VAKGFFQIPGIDYDETFELETICLLFSLAACYDLDIHVVDVNVIGTYLNGVLEEELYMQQPELYCKGNTDVWRLHKALYRLKQSGRVWNIKLNTTFLCHRYSRLLSDQCVYIKCSGSHITIIAVHVNNMTVFVSSASLMAAAETELESMFNIKKLSAIRQLLGMEVCCKADSSIVLSQAQYIAKILEC